MMLGALRAGAATTYAAYLGGGIAAADTSEDIAARALATMQTGRWSASRSFASSQCRRRCMGISPERKSCNGH